MSESRNSRAGRGRGTPLACERGISAVEGLVALILLSGVILGVVAATAASSRVLVGARRDVGYAVVVQQQLEILKAQGYAITSGSNATQPTPHDYDPSIPTRYPMRWTVTGTNPKRIAFISTRGSAEDTTVFYVAEPAP